MSKRVTIQDIAKKVNTSTTTVYKALSGKDKISEKTRAQIIKTAEELGYQPNKSAQALARRQLTVGILVPKVPNEFMSYIVQGCEEGLANVYDFKVNGNIRYFDTHFSTEQSMSIIEDFRSQKVDGLIIQPVLGYKEYVDLIADTIRSGIPIVSLVSPLYENKNTGSVRVNSIVVGQLAGQWVSSVLPKRSKVALLTANKEMLIHRDYVDGFLNYTDKEKIDVIGVYETKDTEHIAYELTEKLLSEHPDIKGIYVTSAISTPVCRCLENHKRDKDVFVVGQDIYPALVDYLKKGTLNATIFQDPVEQGRMAVEMIYQQMIDPLPQPKEYLVVPKLVMNANLECYNEHF